MGCGPQDSGGVVQIAIALDADGQAGVFLIRQGRAYGGGGLIADAGAALGSYIVIGLVEVPQARGPRTDEAIVRNQRPIFVFDLSPEFGRQARAAYRAGVPTDGG